MNEAIRRCNKRASLMKTKNIYTGENREDEKSFLFLPVGYESDLQSSKHTC